MAQGDDGEYADARAMVVDGNLMSRSILVNQLKDLGFGTIVQCSRVVDARRQLESESFDVVLCEQEFERGTASGRDLLDDLRRNQLLPLSTVFIMVTTEASYAKVAEAVESALDAYILKPHTGVGLRDRLNWARQRKESLKLIFKAVDRHDYDWAAQLCLDRFEARGPYWLYAARVGAELMLRLENYAQAQRLFEAVIEAKTLPWAKLGLARSLLAQGDDATAIGTLEKLVRVEPNYSDAYDVLGRAHFETGRFDRALDTFRMGHRLTPHSIMRLQQLGVLAYYAGDPTEADDCLGCAARTGMDSKLFDSQSLVLLAFTRFRLQDRKGIVQCRDDLKKLIEREPENIRWQRHRQVVEVLHLLLDRRFDQASQAVRSIAAGVRAPDFDFEGAANLIGLLTELVRCGVPLEEADHLLEQIGMRFCTSRAVGELLVRATGSHAAYAEHLRGCGAQVLKMAERAMIKSLEGDPAATVRELLAKGGETLNAKLAETAQLVLQRHAAKIADHDRLLHEARVLRARVGPLPSRAMGGEL